MVSYSVPVRTSVSYDRLIPGRVCVRIARIDEKDSHDGIGVGRFDGVAVRLHLSDIVGARGEEARIQARLVG